MTIAKPANANLAQTIASIVTGFIWLATALFLGLTVLARPSTTSMTIHRIIWTGLSLLLVACLLVIGWVAWVEMHRFSAEATKFLQEVPK